ncbi:hypothetical protein DICPUDRAFT_98897 [Dictyostelium purpureum]|uniref:Pesticidal crystal protein N-terminal domain-containing protein n=1 Tax=Dictyostelium purpureum TaxID=5786 RepID=F0ZUK0_DICPU|nr:uncharacterized protein DICPUDRAFT_98897 [Dictyostelium purpureum]EGC32364.1 hypothetical protein DICPUDRAFT_98897 [Dictyostelium purpureum]|eukprot:XP_003291094.1 hypothetical protein DICPUDRAFT_98897 [Dictyostelium purpureum]
MESASIKNMNDFLEYNQKHKVVVKRNNSINSENRVFFNFKRDLGTWLGGLVGSIPFVGAMAAAWFNIGYTHFFMDGEGQIYVPLSAFQEMLNELRKEMEELMNRKLDEMYVDLANKAFAALQAACNEYNTRVAAYEKAYGSGRSMGSMDSKSVPNYLKMNIADEKLINSDENALKEMIRMQHSIVINEMERCFILFTEGTTDQNKLLIGNLVTGTLFYVLIQRDVFYKGAEWGFPNDYINRSKVMISERIDKSMGHITKLLGKGLSMTEVSKENSPDIYNIYKQFAYLDVTRFPLGSKRYPVSSNHTAVIPTEFNDGEKYTYIIETKGSKMTDPLISQQVEHIYDCQSFNCSSYEFKVSRPSKSFTSAVIYIHTSVEVDSSNPLTTFTVDGTSYTSTSEDVKDEVFYLGWPLTRYAKLTVSFNQPKTEFTVKQSYPASGYPVIYGCHAKLILK